MSRQHRWKRGGWFGWAVLWCCLWSFGAQAAQGDAVPDERVLYRDVTGRVVDAAGTPQAGVPVSLLYETAVTDENGGFSFERVPLTHTAEVSLRVQSKNSGLIIGCITVDVPVRFYPVAASAGDAFAIEIVDPSADRPVELVLQPLPAAQVDTRCARCHEDNPCLETATYQDVIHSGKDLRGIIVREDRIAQFKEELQKKGLRIDTYRKMRYQDTHPDGMNMEEIPKLDLEQYRGRYRKPEALFLLDGAYVTCETCHTRHVPTEQKQYVVMPYETVNTLCTQCHL